MKNMRLPFYSLLTGLGFVVVLLAGGIIYSQFNSLAAQHSDFVRKSYSEYVEYLNKNTLAKTAEYIAKQYPFLYDPERLKREAGTDWFWAASNELTKLKDIFGFAYIYYIGKTAEENDNYVFLMSSDIRRDEHPEWLGTPVWQNEVPAFVEKAYKTKERTFSPEPIINEWGTLISAVLPIVNNDVVAGILGVDYDISFMDTLRLQESRITAGENDLHNNILTALIFSIVFLGAIIFCQILLSYKSVIVPVKSVESEERIRLMMDATPMACSIWDTDGNMLDCNMEALKILGLSKKSDYIDRFFDLNPECQPDGTNSREKAAALIKQAFNTGYERFEWVYRTASGEALPVETTLVRVPWKDGYRLTAYSRDLREIKAKEAEAQEIEERTRIMVDEMAFACLFFDVNEKVIDCNQKAIALYGSNGKQDLTDNFFCFSPENQPDGSRSEDKIKEQIRKAFSSGKEIFRWEHLKGDGSPLPAEVSLIRAQRKDGPCIIAYIRDLSDLTETRDNLARITSMVDGSPTISIYIGSQGDIEYMNPAVSAISGWSKEEFAQQGLQLMFSSEDLRLLNQEYLANARKNQNAHFETSISITAKNGESRDFLFSIFSVHLHSGENGVALLGKDITELKKIQQDLVAAKEQAEYALVLEAYYNKAKSDFLSRVSHEMRTPLNAIIGMTDIVKKASGRKEQEPSFKKIEEASEHLLSIVNNILDMTSIDTGGFNWSPGPFSFHKAVQEVIDAVRTKTAAKEQQFITDIDQGIPNRVVSDERRLKQILTNLLSNAVKFTPEQGTVGLSAKMLEDRGNEGLIRFEITDTGIGIAAEAQRYVWNNFEQGDNSISRNYGGTGLGLPLTKHIVELMKGAVRFESEPGAGSRFICDVCLGIAPMDGEPSEKENSDAEDAPPDLTGRRILVVDDMDINREIIFALLEDKGLEFDGAQNGLEAVDLFSKNKYDLVLMDLHMPEMNGIDAARKIRASGQPWAKTAPIISVSADSNAELIAQCLEAGMNDHINKPVAAEPFYVKLAQWLPDKP